MADELDEPFCFDEDVDKSFQLVFPARTVDLVAKDAEEAALLARGFLVRGKAFIFLSSCFMIYGELVDLYHRYLLTKGLLACTFCCK